MRYKLSKKIVTGIINQEIKEHQMPVKILPLTVVENIIYILKIFPQTILDKNSSIKEKKDYLSKHLSKSVGGVYDETRNTIKIILSPPKTEIKEKYLAELIQDTYHEYYHRIYFEEQAKEKNFTLPKLIATIEDIFSKETNLYFYYHDECYEEILADLYGYTKNIEILKKHPNIYKKVKSYLEINKMHLEILKKNYDIESIIYLLIKNGKKISSLPKNKQFNRSLILDNDWNIEELSTKYILLSTRAFLNQIILKELSIEELQIMLAALTYTLNTEQLRKQDNNSLENQIQENLKNWKKDIENSESILELLNQKIKRNKNKINYLNNKITEITGLLEERKSNNKKIRIKKA